MDGGMFRGVFTALIIFGVGIGLTIAIVIPWLWRLAKPLLHAVTG